MCPQKNLPVKYNHPDPTTSLSPIYCTLFPKTLLSGVSPNTPLIFIYMQSIPAFYYDS